MIARTDRQYRGTGAEARRLDRQRRLMDAALLVYGGVGYRGATVKAVCEAAGLSERYFYESFPGSAALFLAVYKEATTKANARFRLAGERAGPDPDTRLRAVLGAYYGGLRAQVTAARVSMIEAPTVSSEVKQAWKACRDDLGEVLADCWPARQTPVAMALRTTVAGAVRQIAIDWIEEDFLQSVDEVVDLARQIAQVLKPDA